MTRPSISIFFISFLGAHEKEASDTISNVVESDEIYWETPEYLSEFEKNDRETRYVYHRRPSYFVGNRIIPLNLMPFDEAFSEVYRFAVSKYKGREQLLTRVIPTLNCLWNDVIFLSPLHPHKQYLEYKRIGFTPKSLQFFQIPLEVLEDKQVRVWKWLSYKKYPAEDPIHESIDSYCEFDFIRYRELARIPNDTKEFYEENFDPENPGIYPRFNWYRIPHILCLDTIDLSDERITVINWEDDPGF